MQSHIDYTRTSKDRLELKYYSETKPTCKLE